MLLPRQRAGEIVAPQEIVRHQGHACAADAFHLDAVVTAERALQFVDQPLVLAKNQRLLKDIGGGTEIRREGQKRENDEIHKQAHKESFGIATIVPRPGGAVSKRERMNYEEHDDEDEIFNP